MRQKKKRGDSPGLADFLEALQAAEAERLYHTWEVQLRSWALGLMAVVRVEVEASCGAFLGGWWRTVACFPKSLCLVSALSAPG